MTKGRTFVKKILVASVGALGSAAVALALGGGIASADDGVVGQTYKDAKAALSQRGLTPVVASTVGDRKDWDNCIVTSATPAPGIDGFGNQSSGKMNVNLNCYAKYSTGQWPGFSIQSPEGQKIYQADLAAKKAREAQEAAAAQQTQDEQLAAADAQQGGE
ncbi:MAG: hypothetical protein JWR46_3229 [Mycobacterium sp.]|nr:hypothetical protein [Mycobacterium sp.]